MICCSQVAPMETRNQTIFSAINKPLLRKENQLTKGLIECKQCSLRTFVTYPFYILAWYVNNS